VIVENQGSKASSERLFEDIDKKVSKQFGNTVAPYINTLSEFRTNHLGIRSAGEDRMQAGDLLLRIPREGMDSEVSAFKRVIAKKNLIAYENREFRQAEALEILKLTERFYNWVTSSLPRA